MMPRRVSLYGESQLGHNVRLSGYARTQEDGDQL